VTAPVAVPPVFLLASRHAYLHNLAAEAHPFFQHVLPHAPGARGDRRRRRRARRPREPPCTAAAQRRRPQSAAPWAARHGC